jgi:hypothetical protein
MLEILLANFIDKISMCMFETSLEASNAIFYLHGGWRRVPLFVFLDVFV